MSSVTSRTFRGAVLVSAFSLIPAFSQQPAPAPQPAPQPAPTQPTGPGGQPGGGQQPGIGTPGGRDPNVGRQPFPGRDPSQQQQNWPEMQRVFMFSGRVMLDDGTPPPEQVSIERVCNGVARVEGYTDSKGRFSFTLGQNQSVLQDASVGSADPFGNTGMSGPPGMMGPRGQNISERDLMACELRASLAGFRSDVFSLAGRRSMDNPNIGTLVLHRLAKVDGFTFSATSAYAPKDARKAFDKGRDAAKKKKWADAEKELSKATTAYATYAAAWYELGRVYQAQDKVDDARRAYAESIKSDAKFINPYAQMVSIAAGQKNWEETADYAAKVIKLNPYFSPQVYFLSSVANLNLNKLEPAEEHAREALKMDEKHVNPRIPYLLGVILAQKQDYAGAAEHMRAYLKSAPQASDAPAVKKQLEDVERMLANRQGAVPAQQ